MEMQLDKEILARLEQPFEPEDVEWRPGSKGSNNTALALGYTNARVYMDRLHEVVGGYWSDTYEIKTLHDRLIVTCFLTVGGATRTDVGEEMLEKQVWDREDRKYVLKPNENAATTAAAQAFKRACTKFGLGSFFYKMPKLWGDLEDGKNWFKDSSLRSLDANLRDWIDANYGKPLTTGEAVLMKTPKGLAFGDCTMDQLGILAKDSKSSRNREAATMLLAVLAEKHGATNPEATYNETFAA